MTQCGVVGTFSIFIYDYKKATNRRDVDQSTNGIICMTCLYLNIRSQYPLMYPYNAFDPWDVPIHQMPWVSVLVSQLSRKGNR